ncbi:hypothetical protein ACKFKG_16540 [Phormidesmis sp. 146-35]
MNDEPTSCTTPQGVAEPWDELPKCKGELNVQSPPILGDLGGEKINNSHTFIPSISNARLNLVNNFAAISLPLHTQPILPVAQR